MIIAYLGSLVDLTLIMMTAIRVKNIVIIKHNLKDKYEGWEILKVNMKGGKC